MLRDLANPGEFALYGLSDGMSPQIIRFDEGYTALIGDAGGAGEKDFTIRNLSEQGVLKLTGSPRIAFSGTIAPLLSVTQEPAGYVHPEGQTTFTVRYDGGAMGQTAQMIIESNDPDQEEFVIVMQSN